MPTRPLKNELMGCEGAFEDILAFFQATPAPSFCTDEEIDRKQIKDIVGIDTSLTFKDLVPQSQELERSEDDEGVDSDGIFEDIENDDLSLSDDEPKVKKREKSQNIWPSPWRAPGSALLSSAIGFEKAFEWP